MTLTLLYTVNKSSITFTSAIVPLVHPLSSISLFLPGHSKYNPSIHLFSNNSQWVLNRKKITQKENQNVLVFLTYLLGKCTLGPPTPITIGEPLQITALSCKLCIFPLGQGNCNHRILGNMESKVHIFFL